MKHSLHRSLLVFVALVLVGPAATASASEEAQIRAVLKAQAAAWNRGNIDGYMAGYARDRTTTFVGDDVMTRGWETVRSRYKKKYDSRAKMGTLSFSEVRIIRLGGDDALVTGRWKLTRATDRAYGRFTLLFRKRPEGWRIVYDHSSGAG